jgi:GGDEF domain-containing protein
MVWNSIPVLMMAVITAYIFLYHLAKFLLQSKTYEDLYFALLCLAVVLYDSFSIGLYNSRDVSVSILWQRGQFFAVSLIATATVFFIYNITETRVNVLFYCLAIAYGLLGLMAFLPFDFVLSTKAPLVRSFSLFSLTLRYYEARPGLLITALFILIVLGMVYGYRLLLKSYSAGNRKRTLPLLVAFTLFFLTDVADMLNGLGLIRFVYLIEYSFLGLILVMEYSLLKRFVEMHSQVESLNVLLEGQVQSRTENIETLIKQLRVKNQELEEKNLRLQEIAERDSLTELLNHAAFHRRLREIFNESRRNRFSFAVLMFDVDSFKSLNDTFGHPVGDMVLKKISDVLRGRARSYDVKSRLSEGQEDLRLRNYDVAGRYGGDEFALILPYCEPPEAEIVCRRVMSNIQAIQLEEHPELRISISLGGTVLAREAGCDNEQILIKTADRELYRAKMHGKNQYRIEPYQNGN